MIKILKKHTILYVEDEPEIQKNITEYLSSYFKEVYTASNGEKALELFEQHFPDVILLDINIPKINGLSVAKQIRETNKDVKIVILTAFTDKEKLLLATELKLVKYLVKPVNPKLFKDTLIKIAQEFKENTDKFVKISKDCIWDIEEENLLVNSQIVKLNQKEHQLLKLLLKYKGQTVSYEEIIINLWEDSFEKEVSIDSVKNQVSHLRKKIPNECIVSVYGQGYILK
jgi:DNA-binding response OmpR family regulator